MKKEAYMPHKTIIIQKSRPGDNLFSGARWVRVIVNERGSGSVNSGYELTSEPLVEFIRKVEGVEEKIKDRVALEVVRHFTKKE